MPRIIVRSGVSWSQILGLLGAIALIVLMGLTYKGSKADDEEYPDQSTKIGRIFMFLVYIALIAVFSTGIKGGQNGKSKGMCIAAIILILIGVGILIGGILPRATDKDAAEDTDQRRMYVWIQFFILLFLALFCLINMITSKFKSYRNTVEMMERPLYA